MNINRGGEDEDQSLSDDVSRLKEDRKTWILIVQLAPQPPNVIPRGAMFARFERHQDLTIERSDDAAVAEGHVESAVGKPDVVDNIRQFTRRNHTAYGVFHSGEDLLGLFHPCAGSRAHVQPDLAGVHQREKVGADKWNERHAYRGDEEKTQCHQFSVPERRFKQIAITLAPELKPAVKSVMHLAEETAVIGFRCALRSAITR